MTTLAKGAILAVWLDSYTDDKLWDKLTDGVVEDSKLRIRIRNRLLADKRAPAPASSPPLVPPPSATRGWGSSVVKSTVKSLKRPDLALEKAWNGAKDLIVSFSCKEFGWGCPPGPDSLFQSVMTSSVAASFAKAISETRVGVDITQQVVVDCANDVPSKNGENTISGCTSCQQTMLKMFEARRTLQESYGNANDPALFDSSSVLSSILRVCRHACSSCVTTDVNQDLLMRLDIEQKSDTEWETSISSSVRANVGIVMKTTQDALGQLGQALSAEEGTIVTEISRRAEERINSVTVRKILNDIKLYQSLTVLPGSTSISISRVNQTITSSMVLRVVSETVLQNNLYSKSEYDAAIEYIKSQAGFKNALQSIADSLEEADKSWSTIMIGLAIISFLLTSIIFIVQYVYNQNRTNSLQRIAIGEERRSDTAYVRVVE